MPVQMTVSLFLLVLGMAVAGRQPEDLCVRCCTPTPYIQLSFYLRLGGGDGCGDQDYLDQGVRLEIRGSREPWSEIRFYSLTTETATPSSVTLENSESVFVQENVNYSFPLHIIESMDPVFITENICAFNNNNSIQFRWVQYPYRTSGENENTWSVDNITVTYWDGSCERVLFQEDFEGTITQGVMNGIVTTPPCGPTATGNASYFQGDITNVPNQRLYRRRRINTPSLSLTGSTECLPSPAEGCYANRSACMTLIPSCSVDGCSCEDGYSKEELSCIVNVVNISLGQSEYHVAEGSGVVEVCVEIMGGELERDLMVTLITEDGTAVATRDYEPVSIELATCCANITIINDIILEVKETFLISLSSDDPLVITLNSAAVHITDNDIATIGFEHNVVMVTEEEGMVEVDVAVLVGYLGTTITVNVTSTDSNAGSPMDYTGINTTLTFHPGTTRLPLFVAIKDDTVDEMAEIFFLSLFLQTPMEAVTLDPSTAMVSIVDNDGVSFCGAEEVDGYSWPGTPGGKSVTLSCREGSGEVTMRECSPTGEWQMADLSQCALEAFNRLLDMLDNGTAVTMDNYDEFILVMNEFVVNAPVENQTDDNLQVVIETARSSAIITADSQTIVAEETVINTVELLDGLDDWDQEVLEDSNDVPVVVQSFQTIIAAFVTQENFTNFTFTGEDITVTAERVEVEALQHEGRLFSVSADAGETEARDDGNVTELEISSAFLPPALFQLLQNDSEIEIVFTLYEGGQLFPVREKPQSYESDIVVGTPVIAATVVNLDLSDLTEDQSVVILLRMNDLGNVTVTQTRCVSYDFDVFRWTTEGCTTEVNDDVITCTCNHLTNFAALVDVCSRTEGDCLDEEEQFALDVMSIIGVVLSLIGIVLTIITLLVFKKLRERDASKYHIQLCIALGCMLLVFVIGIDRTEEYGGCVLVSALIQYFTLVSVMWMGAEAVMMFQKLVIVFVRITTKFIIAVSLVCWLAPLVPVIIPLTIDPDFMVTFTVTDIDFCFIGEIGVFFGAFLGPIFAILLFNFVIFFIVIFVLIRHTLGTFKRKKDPKAAVRLLIGIMGIMFLFGLTWLFGAFTVADASLAFQILFVVFNSLQGFFTFFFLCVFSSDARQLWMEELTCGRYKSKALHPSHAKYISSGTAATMKATASSNLTFSTLASKPTSEIPSNHELPVITTDQIEKKDLETNTSTFKGEPTQIEGIDTNSLAVADDSVVKVSLAAEEEV